MAELVTGSVFNAALGALSAASSFCIPSSFTALLALLGMKKLICLVDNQGQICYSSCIGNPVGDWARA